MPRSRSILDETNILVFRHPLMFQAENVAALYSDWDGKTLDQYEGTDRDVGWVIRKYRTHRDDIAMVQLQQLNGIDWAALVEQYQKDPAKLLPAFMDEQKVVPGTAELTVMTVRWYGPYFTVAKSFKRSAKGQIVCDASFTVEDFTGSGLESERKRRHPLHMQVMPILPEWVDTLDPEVCDMARTLLRLFRTRRSPAQEAEFPAGPVGVADADGAPAAGGLPAEGAGDDDGSEAPAE